MFAGLDPFSFLIVSIAGWMDQRQHQVEENRVLREQIGNRRMRFTHNQRCRLALRAKKLSRKILGQVATIVTPETLISMASTQCPREVGERLGKNFSLDIGIRSLPPISHDQRELLGVHESDVLDAKSLPKIEMPNRNGFVPAVPVWPPDPKKPSWF